MAGFATDAAASGASVRGGDAIESVWAVAEDFGARGLIDNPVAGLRAADPERQGLLVANTAEMLAVLPDGDDDSLLGWAAGGLGTASFGTLTVADPAVERLDRMLPSLAERIADLVDHRTFPIRFQYGYR